jgi:regulator of RNase E activity RraA
MVIPRHLADEVAADALEQERYEAWVLKEVESGKRSSASTRPTRMRRRATRCVAWLEEV